MELRDKDGLKKYLTNQERERFKEASLSQSREKRTFALMMLHTGCRISEALSLKKKDIELDTGLVVFETLKRRKKGVRREIPLPDEFIRSIDDVHDIRSGKNSNTRLWGYSRTTGWRIILSIMEEAKIKGSQASPKGLRHGFAIACVENNIPLNMIKKWMGHANIETTAIYADAVGKEERELISRLWE